MSARVPDVNVALERARITAKINSLTAMGTALLLQSVAASAPVEAKSLHEEARTYLNQADEIRDSFATRFPKSLNLYHRGE